MKKPSVAIILINWNNEIDTIDCIHSLEKITYPNYKIFLSDNGSKKKSLLAIRQAIQRIKNINIELIENKKNLGFSGGNNVAIKKALEENFDYILLLNNDTTVEPNFLDELIAVGELNDEIGILGPKIYYHPDYFLSSDDQKLNKIKSSDDKKILRIWFGGGKFTWFGGGRHLQIDEIDKNPDEKEPKETDYMTGCAFLIKSDVIKKIGLMNESYFLYYEDTDWSLRTRKAGYKIIYVPSSKIYHKVTRSIGAQIGKPKIFYYHIRNALLLSKLNAPFIILGGIYIWSGIHYLKQILKLVIFPSKREISKMIMRGIKDFYKGKFGKYE